MKERLNKANFAKTNSTAAQSKQIYQRNIHFVLQALIKKKRRKRQLSQSFCYIIHVALIYPRNILSRNTASHFHYTPRGTTGTIQS